MSSTLIIKINILQDNSSHLQEIFHGCSMIFPPYSFELLQSQESKSFTLSFLYSASPLLLLLLPLSHTQTPQTLWHFCVISPHFPFFPVIALTLVQCNIQYLLHWIVTVSPHKTFSFWGPLALLYFIVPCLDPLRWGPIGGQKGDWKASIQAYLLMLVHPPGLPAFMTLLERKPFRFSLPGSSFCSHTFQVLPFQTLGLLWKGVGLWLTGKGQWKLSGLMIMFCIFDRSVGYHIHEIILLK